MTVTGEMFAAKAKELPSYGVIPYSHRGGETPAGMDCQGLVRWVMKELGMQLPAQKGTNYMWRNCLSEKGNIGDCVIRWGRVPLGALIFIRLNDGGEKKHGYDDSQGNIDHVYVKISPTQLIHASAGNGKVVTRDFSDKEVPNGGPNAYGMLLGVAYTGNRVPSDTQRESEASDIEDDGQHVAPESSAPATAKEYVRVQTPDGNPVKIREKHDTNIYKYKAPNGTVMLKTGNKDKYFKVLYEGKERLVDKNFVVPCEVG